MCLVFQNRRLTVVFAPLGYGRGLWSGGVVVIVGGGGGSLVGRGSRGRHVRWRPVPGRSHQTQLLGQLLMIFLVYIIKYTATRHLNLKIPTMWNVLVFNFHFASSIEFSFVPYCLWGVNIFLLDDPTPRNIPTHTKRNMHVIFGGSLESAWWLFLAFCPKILGGGGDLWMVIYHSIKKLLWNF